MNSISSRQCAAMNYEEASLTQEDEGDMFRRNVANHLTRLRSVTPADALVFSV